MTKLNLSKVLGLALGCAALLLGAIYMSADPRPSESKQFHANAGTTFVLLPASGGVRSHNIDGVVRVSSMGDCSFHATANLVTTSTPGSYLITDGIFLFTSADGKSTLTATAAGTLVTNPTNPYMADIEYDVTFTGGTGSQAGAHGFGKLHGFVMFTTIDLVQPDDTTVPPEPPAPLAGSNTGKACWLLDGDLDYDTR